MTLDEFRTAFEANQLDSLKDFSMACRMELMRMTTTS
jgi:hypothetical protein